MQHFNLVPFDPADAPTAKVSGWLTHSNGLLEVEFRLDDFHSAVIIPPRAIEPQRRNNLWRETCFELFYAPDNEGPYHEINLTPAGHWNLYRFDGYRLGMREEKIDCLYCSFDASPGVLTARVMIDIGRLGLDGRRLYTRPCAVILSRGGTCSYWAIHHPGAQPDFHNWQTEAVILSSPAASLHS